MNTRKVLIFIVYFIVSANFAQAQERSPDQVIDRFFTQLRSLNLSGMVGCFANGIYTAHYDFKALSNRLGAISPTGYLPERYPIYSQFNKLRKEFEAVTDIASLILNISKEGGFVSTTIPIDSDNDIESYIKSINPDDAKKFTVLTRYDPVEDVPSARDSLGRTAKLFGAEEIVERIVFVKFPKGIFSVPFALIRYDGTWYIRDLSSSVAGAHGVKKMSEQDMKDLGL